MNQRILKTDITKWVIFAGTVFLSIIAIQFIGMKQTSAMFNRGEYHGFFTNSYATSGDYVQPGGISVNNAEEFISWYRGKLNGNQQERVMASFTIRTMMNQKVGDPSQRTSVPQSTVDDWAGLVRDYARRGLIEFHANYYFNKNTFYQEGSGDIAWYYDGPVQLPSIVFKHPSGKRYAIKRSCANPVGELSGFERVEPAWELRTPVSQVNSGGGWKKTVYARAGETVKFRHQIGNNGPDRAENFETWREYSYKGRSAGTTQSLNRGEERYVGGDGANGYGYQVPPSAQEGDKFCERQAVNPARYGGTGTLRDTYACVIVRVDPPDGGTPDFNLSADCRTGIHITNLRHPDPNQDRNVATRVRVYPNNQGSGIVIDQNGNPQSDGNFVFRTRGDVHIPWPSGYGNITWRVDVRAFELNHVNENNRSILQSNYISLPCWDLTPSTAAVPGFIEQGGAVGFNHYVTNSSEKTAENINTCVIANYSIYNPNGGNTGEYCSTLQVLSFGEGTSGPLPNSSPAVYTDGSTPLGTVYCQRYRVDPASELSGGARESANACTKVVGGKTALGVTSDKGSIEPTETANPTVTLTTTGFVGHEQWPGYAAGCSYYLTQDMNPDGQPGTPIPGTNGSCGYQVNGNGPHSVSRPYQASVADVGKEICLVANMTIGNTLFINSPTTAWTCFKVVIRPYMKVQSGDVAAGNGFLGGNCINSSASVVGWNKGDGPTYSGAGATFAVLAQNKIQDFVSGQGVSQIEGYGYAPTNLSFANTVIGGGRYGGSFGSGSCIPDYYGNMPSTAKASWPGVNAANSDSSNDQDYKITSNNLNLSGGILRQGSNIRLYVDGNVYISDNIVTDASGGKVVSVSAIPNFTLIVKGNIYIAPNVSRLYGTYVAQPNGSSGGNIFTCANSGLTPYNTLGPAQWYASCQNQLVVTGSLTAKKVNFLRVKGSLYQADGGNVAGTAGYNNAAEIIQYNPLTGLRQSASEDTARSSTYDSVTTLPPVL